jgi:hypothetical protein
MSGQGERGKDAPAGNVARKFSRIERRLTENAFFRRRANPSEAGRSRGRSENRFVSAIASNARRLKNLCSCYSAVAANRRHDASGINSFLTPGTRASRRCLTSFLTVTGEMDKRFAAARMSSKSGCGCVSFTSNNGFPVLAGAISSLSIIGQICWLFFRALN